MKTFEEFNWFKKDKEIKPNHYDIDPYGEEDWGDVEGYEIFNNFKWIKYYSSPFTYYCVRVKYFPIEKYCNIGTSCNGVFNFDIYMYRKLSDKNLKFFLKSKNKYPWTIIKPDFEKVTKEDIDMIKNAYTDNIIDPVNDIFCKENIIKNLERLKEI
jgi:hypothetical protein